jgi:uncharacterized flavoprotein (TIGR03862 family)
MNVVVVGAGPAGLMAAEIAARAGAQVTVYDRMPSAGRKFLMAGRGGLNLTHNEDLEPFLRRYGEARRHLRAAVEAFPPLKLREWAEGLGQKTFVGTSGRVFPEAMKASPLLRAWLRRLDDLGVRFILRHRWMGWDKTGALAFQTPDGVAAAKADAVVLALGGTSWPKLGSDGGWTSILSEAGIGIAPLRPANSGFRVNWSNVMREKFAGEPLKRIALSFGDRSVRGEAIVTHDGVEGGAVYALSGVLRDAIEKDGKAVLHIDLRPDVSAQQLAARLGQPRGKQSLSTFLRKAANLAPVATGLLHETGKIASMPPRELAALIKAVPVTLTGIASIERAISTAGGISFDEVDGSFMLKKKPGVFVAGEMLDWDAPTGGYLLQACFATGAAAGYGATECAKRSAGGSPMSVAATPSTGGSTP